MTLRTLAEHLHDLPQTACAPDCWWAHGNALARTLAFEACQPLASSQRLAADHYAIVGHAQLLDDVQQRLSALEPQLT